MGAEGSHALETLITEISKDVIDPQTKVSVFERAKANRVVNASGAKDKKEAMAKTTVALGAMGSGSDYSSFIQHLGVPSLDLGFGGENDGGEYHSIYDSYDDYKRFKDPGFDYGVALSKTAGRAALRLADADLLPFDFRSLSKTVNGYVKDLMSKTEQLRETTSTENEVIRTNNYALANDPTDKLKIPTPKAEVPFIDFSPLQNALTALEKAGDHAAEAWTKAINSNTDHSAMDQSLYKAEQLLLAETGLPRRGWYKHTLYAPGFYTGYGVKTIPGVREAIEQRNWKEAQEQIGVVAGAISRLADYLQKIN
jgi:N-acetylated-alpha-linked acidic dipeptidase